jgi:hypothetical protein
MPGVAFEARPRAVVGTEIPCQVAEQRVSNPSSKNLPESKRFHEPHHPRIRRVEVSRQPR